MVYFKTYSWRAGMWIRWLWSNLLESLKGREYGVNWTVDAWGGAESSTVQLFLAVLPAFLDFPRLRIRNRSHTSALCEYVLENPRCFRMIYSIKVSPTNPDWTKSLRDGLCKLSHSVFCFLYQKQWKVSPDSSIVKLPHQTIKQEPSHCLWKEYHPSAWLASDFMT